MEEEKTLAEAYQLENSRQFKKAYSLVENRDIKVEELYVDDIKFKVNGNNGDYILHYNPQTKEAVCTCKGDRHNEGDCYHKLAAPIYLAKGLHEGWKFNDERTAYYQFKDEIGEREAARQVQIEDTSLVIELDEENTLLGIETYNRNQDLPDNIIKR